MSHVDRSRPLWLFSLRKTRVHEVCGPGAAAFCALAAASGEGPVLWVVESHRTEGLNPVGLAPLLAPERVLTVRTGTQTDSLAVAEEALKDGAAPFVAIEISAPLDLREGGGCNWRRARGEPPACA